MKKQSKYNTKSASTKQKLWIHTKNCKYNKKISQVQHKNSKYNKKNCSTCKKIMSNHTKKKYVKCQKRKLCKKSPVIIINFQLDTLSWEN